MVAWQSKSEDYQMHRLFGSQSHEEGNEWLSVADLMAGLMVIFLFIAIVYIRPVAEQNRQIKDIAVTWQEKETEIYEALLEEFKDDLRRWDAEIEKDTLTVRFKSPEVLFETGKDTIRLKFAIILKNFFPRYVEVLKPYKDSIEEIRVEGHTSSRWNDHTEPDEAYFLNMALSQARTRAVLKKVFNMYEVSDNRHWLQPLVTANGLSSSRPRLDEKGEENHEKSRRVEFRVRTTARTEIMRIIEAAQ